MLTDVNYGLIHCLSHDPELDILTVGSGKDVILANYRTQGERAASWYNTRRLPPPPGFPRLRAIKLPEPTAQSIQFLQIGRAHV